MIDGRVLLPFGKVNKHNRIVSSVLVGGHGNLFNFTFTPEVQSNYINRPLYLYKHVKSYTTF